jgi:hypothetical protein
MSEHRRQRMPWKYVCSACGVTWPCRQAQVELMAKMAVETSQGDLVKNGVKASID